MIRAAENVGVDLDELAERVMQFKMLDLPGQPQMMHMGTSYLVNDLWSAVKALAKAQGDGQ